MFFAFFIAHIFKGVMFILQLYISEHHIFIISDKICDNFIGFNSVFIGEVFLVFMEGIFGDFDAVILFSFTFFMDCVYIGSNFKFDS